MENMTSDEEKTQELLSIFVTAFARRGLIEWQNSFEVTQTGGHNGVKKDGLAAAAYMSGAALGAFALLTTGVNVVSTAASAAQAGTSKVQEKFEKPKCKEMVASLHNFFPTNRADPVKTMESLAKVFISIGVEAGMIFEKVISAAHLVGKDWDQFGIEKLGIDAMDRGLAHILGNECPEDLSPRNHLLYGVIYGESERKTLGKIGLTSGRGRTIQSKSNVVSAWKSPRGSWNSEEMNTHEALTGAWPIREISKGKWESYKKKGTSKKGKLFYRRLANFEEENDFKFLNEYYDVEDLGLPDPQFRVLNFGKAKFESDLFTIVTQSHTKEELKTCILESANDTVAVLKNAIVEAHEKLTVAVFGNQGINPGTDNEKKKKKGKKDDPTFICHTSGVELTLIVNTTLAPDLAFYAGRICKDIEEFYRIISAYLDYEGRSSPSVIWLIFDPQFGGKYSGNSAEDRIRLSPKYFRDRPEEIGEILAFTVLSIEQYVAEPKPPAWWTYGLAIYFKTFWYEKGLTARKPLPSDKYDTNIHSSAYLLDYINRKYSQPNVYPDFIQEAHRFARIGEFETSKIFQKRTGKSVEELWYEMLQESVDE